jgi:hypothetical protein
MRVKVDSSLSGKSLFEYLIENKKDLIAQKKSMPITTDIFSCKSIYTGHKGTSSIKNEGEGMNAGITKVSFVGNMSMFADSYLDVLGDNSFAKTIRENGPQGKKMIRHLKNHQYDTDGVVGTPTSIYSKSLNLKDLGVDSHIENGIGLIMDSDVKRKYDRKTFEMYTDEDINQHSIGLQYGKIALAINDEEYPEEKKIYDTYLDKVINREVVQKSGYFWYVSEYKLFEISAVLMGANELTPTLSTIKSIDQPPNSTDTEPVSSTPKRIDSFYLNI